MGRSFKINKLRHAPTDMRIATYLFGLIFVVTGVSPAGGQECATSAMLIRTVPEFTKSVAGNDAKQMVDLARFIPGIVIRMPYATTGNFTGIRLYPKEQALLRRAPAVALFRVQQELRKKGYGLLLYDAYRPFSVTCTMWRKAKDRHYVANPWKASKHNRGTAVDISLVRLATGAPLNMGTGFDCFADSAHHNFKNLPPDALANRDLLTTTLLKAGFTLVPNEWWHYNWPDPDNLFEALNLSFDSINSVIYSVDNQSK